MYTFSTILRRSIIRKKKKKNSFNDKKQIWSSIIQSPFRGAFFNKNITPENARARVCVPAHKAAHQPSEIFQRKLSLPICTSIFTSAHIRVEAMKNSETTYCFLIHAVTCAPPAKIRVFEK